MAAWWPQATILYFTLLVFFLWRLFVNSRIMKAMPKTVQWVGEEHFFPTVCFFIIMTVFIGDSFFRTVWMFLQFGAMSPQRFGTDFCDDQDVAFPMWLRVVSLPTPLAVLATFGFVVYSCYTHLFACRGKMTKTRAQVLQILMLPMVFSSMAFQSVLLLWDAFSGRVEDHPRWKCPRMPFIEIENSANTDTADLYEAWALFQFSQLILHRISLWIKQDQDDEERPTDVGTDRAPQRLQTVHLKSKMLSETLSENTTQGVMTFVATSAVYALYTLFKQVYTFVCDKTLQWCSIPFLTSDHIEDYLFGGGFVASCIAIANVVTIELAFHKQLEGRFHRADTEISEDKLEAGHMPKVSMKFWSIKLLVSISFMQKGALMLLSGYITTLQRMLLYTSLICYELLGIAYMHIVAWRADELWLEKEEDEQDPDDQKMSFCDRMRKRFKSSACGVSDITSESSETSEGE